MSIVSEFIAFCAVHKNSWVVTIFEERSNEEEKCAGIRRRSIVASSESDALNIAETLKAYGEIHSFHVFSQG